MLLESANQQQMNVVLQVTTKQVDQTPGVKSSATDGVTVKFVKNLINDGTLSLLWRAYRWLVGGEGGGGG